jgi:two-component system sensor histidine kinase FlrB
MSGLALEKKVTPLPGHDGALLGRIADINDISHQLDRSQQALESRIVQLQVQLAQSNQQRMQEFDAREKLADRLDLILGVMPVAVILLDGRGVVSQANAMAEELLGCELPGTRWLDVIRTCFAPTPADGHEVLLRNGRLVSLATQSLRNETGQIIVLTDQTETRRLQDNLNHHRKLSEMGRMTASLAHQIRTPLSSAILYADHLKNPALPDEKKRHYVDRIRNQLNQLEQQVRDILIFSKGGVVLDQRVTVEELCRRLQDQLREVCQLHKAECEIDCAVIPGHVRCNPELLLSAFGNLVENSIQACRQHKIAPQLRFAMRQSKDALLEIRLIDNGLGIPAGFEQKILEPFFTTKSTGTGLGLAVVNAIVQGHGGTFAISNQPPGGASAIMLLPMMPQD